MKKILIASLFLGLALYPAESRASEEENPVTDAIDTLKNAPSVEMKPFASAFGLTALSSSSEEEEEDEVSKLEGDTLLHQVFCMSGEEIKKLRTSKQKGKKKKIEITDEDREKINVITLGGLLANALRKKDRLLYVDNLRKGSPNSLAKDLADVLEMKKEENAVSTIADFINAKKVKKKDPKYPNYKQLKRAYNWLVEIEQKVQIDFQSGKKEG